ncbi:uncharacterized protein LOC126771101 isoform X3 [Nymphalis io]|uniref:uncharacterized protein LOC126771101 isoform X3 n=1 Tax=Inachis io TaxID=171585 RepID=UPI00216725ED|nr:uncharacterized protein LOC126771101 isoform X3 [Nymphalis io]
MSKLKIYIKFNFMAFILIITIFNKLVMMIRGKGDKDIVYGTCKSHINRSENDLYKICPSKLSKQELEDLYFALFESNIQLKKTLNGQKDEIKVLTTKVQRLTATGNRNQACCAKSSAVINEQKELISDLNKSNGQLSERIRLLNMRLCSAKQFLRRGTSQSTSRCSKCCLAFNTSIKNSSMSALYTKRSVANVGIEATSCDFLDKENIPVKLIEIASNQNEIKSAREENCHQNKCRTTIDELKEKISILEEELIKTHDQYSERLNKSIEEVAALKNENTRARSEAAAAEQHLQAQHRHLLELLRAQELRADDLEAQLMVERGKVSELEMRLKSADLSRHVAKTLEKQYTSSIALVPNSCPSTTFKASSDKANDDSGYAETSQDKSRGNADKGFPTVPNNDQVILDQIVSLQAELASLKHSLKYQKEALKQEHTSNSDNVLKQKSIHGTSSELDNGHFASRIGGSKTYSLGPKKPAPLATSSPQDRTYRRGSAGVLRASSPDSTEGEISSLTDLPDETDDKSPFDYMSPGERGGSTSRLSTSLLSDTSLSEGELCPASNSSCNDINEKFDITCRDSSMQEALRAAGAEVSRCRRLLRSHTRAPTDVDSVSGYPYNYTLPLI